MSLSPSCLPSPRSRAHWIHRILCRWVRQARKHTDKQESKQARTQDEFQEHQILAAEFRETDSGKPIAGNEFREAEFRESRILGSRILGQPNSEMSNSRTAQSQHGECGEADFWKPNCRKLNLRTEQFQETLNPKTLNDNEVPCYSSNQSANESK